MLSFKDVEKRNEYMKQFKRKCKGCDHTIIILPIAPKKVCNWCGTMNYYDKKEEFKDKVNKLRKKVNDERN